MHTLALSHCLQCLLVNIKSKLCFRPLPTLIKRKRRSAFYGDDSGSEPDVSGRLGSRTSEVRVESEGANNSRNVSSHIDFWQSLPIFQNCKLRTKRTIRISLS